MNRRDFLKLLGVGTAALAVEPVRKMWFVPSNAPVGSRVELADSAYIFTSDGLYASMGRGPWSTLAEDFAKDPSAIITVPEGVEIKPLTFRSDPSPSEWFYREPSDESYTFGWDPPEFTHGLAAYHQEWAEREHAERVARVDEFRRKMASTVEELYRTDPDVREMVDQYALPRTRRNG